MGTMSPTQPAVGDLATAAWADEVAQDVVSLSGEASAWLLHTPGGNEDTSSSTTVTWFTMGNVTVPTWATKAIVILSYVGVSAIATGINCTSVLKIGSVSGTSKRILDAATTNRFHWAVVDQLTGLSTGSQSVTVSAAWTAGTANVYRIDTTSHVSAQFIFKP